MSRHQAREKALQHLFQLDVNKQSLMEEIESLKNDSTNSFYVNLLTGVLQEIENIDEILANHLENWTIDRIAAVEKTVLRIAIYEIKYMDDVPSSVSINEAVELAKKYGDEKSGKFVNGVLAKLI